MKQKNKPRTKEQKAQRKLRKISKDYSVKQGLIYYKGKRVGKIHDEP